MNLGDWFEEDTSTESIARDCSYPGAGYAQVCGHEVESHVESWPWMKTLLDVRARKELVERLTKLRPDAQPIWGRMSAHQMVCHLSDSLRAALGEKHISRSTSLFKRVILKRLALWARFHGRTVSKHALRWIKSRAARRLWSLLRIWRSSGPCLDVWANVEDRALALRLSPHRSSPAAVQGIGLERKCRAPNPDEQSMTVESPTMRTIRIVAGVQKLLKGTIIWLRWPATSGIV